MLYRKTGAAAGALLVSTLLSACASSGSAGHVPVPRPFPMPGSPKTDGGSSATPPSGPAAAPLPVVPPPETPSTTSTTSTTSTGAPSREAAPKAFDSYALVGSALDLRGTPYLDGGASPHGFDCSGFTQYVFAQYGVALPRATRDQFRLGSTIKPKELTAGDLVFFATTEPGASHVAIAVSGDQFVHAPSSTGVVRVERLSASYWSQRFIGARRVR